MKIIITLTLEKKYNLNKKAKAELENIIINAIMVYIRRREYRKLMRKIK